LGEHLGCGFRAHPYALVFGGEDDEESVPASENCAVESVLAGVHAVRLPTVCPRGRFTRFIAVPVEQETLGNRGDDETQPVRRGLACEVAVLGLRVIREVREALLPSRVADEPAKACPFDAGILLELGGGADGLCATEHRHLASSNADHSASALRNLRRAPVGEHDRFGERHVPVVDRLESPTAAVADRASTGGCDRSCERSVREVGYLTETDGVDECRRAR
jgi:hypothetical protein